MKPWHSSLIHLSKYIKIIAAIVFSISNAQAQIIDSVSAEVGVGHHSTMYKLAIQKSITNPWSFFAEHDIHPYWEFNVSELRNQRYQNIPGQSQWVTSVGVTPILRWQPNMDHGFGVELGIGANYFSPIYDNAGAKMATRFQFGDHIGLVYKFNKSFEISAKFQHYSNAGIKKPNPAVNYGTIKLAYMF